MEYLIFNKSVSYIEHKKNHKNKYNIIIFHLFGRQGAGSRTGTVSGTHGQSSSPQSQQQQQQRVEVGDDENVMALRSLQIDYNENNKSQVEVRAKANNHLTNNYLI